MRVPGRKLLVLLFCFLNIESRKYEFKAFYQCEDNEFEEVYVQHTQEVSYVCKNWIQKVQITEAKNTFIRFESKFREREQEIEEQEQREQEEEEEREKQRQKEEKEKRKEEREKRIKQIEEQIRKRRLKNTNQPKHTLHTSLNPSAPTFITLSQKKSQTTNSDTLSPINKRHSHTLGPQNNPHIPYHFKSLRSQHNQNNETRSIGAHFQNQNVYGPAKDQNVYGPAKEKEKAKTIQNLGWIVLDSKQFQLPKHNFYDSFSPKDSRFVDPSNCIEHNFMRRRHRQEDEDEGGEEEEKFKPLISHRNHPVDDVLFMFEVIQMNKIIFEQSSQDVLAGENKKEVKSHPMKSGISEEEDSDQEEEEETEEETDDQGQDLESGWQKKVDFRQQKARELDGKRKDDRQSSKVQEEGGKFIRRNQ